MALPPNAYLVKTSQLDAASLVAGGAQIPPGDVLAYLRNAQQGDPRWLYAFYEEMLARDTHLDNEVGKAVDRVAGRNIEIAAPDALIQRFGEKSSEVKDAQRIADAAKSAFLAPEVQIQTVIEDAMLAFMRGVSAVNVVTVPGGLGGYERFVGIMPIPGSRLLQGVVKATDDRQTEWMVQLTDKWSDIHYVKDINAEFSGAIAVFDPEAAIVNLSRRGRLRRCLQPWVIRNFGLAWWSRWAEVYGMPMRTAEYPPNDMKQKAIVTEILKNIGADAYAAIPAGMKINMDGTPVGGAGVHQPLLDWCAIEMSKAINSSTLTFSGEAGSYARDATHEEVARERAQTRARKVAAYFRTELIKPWVARNFSPDAADTLCPDVDIRVPNGVDRQALALFTLTARQSGLRLSEEWWYEEAEIPMPKDGARYVGQALDEAAKQLADQQQAQQEQKVLPPSKKPLGQQTSGDTGLSAKQKGVEGWAVAMAHSAAADAADPYKRIIDAAIRAKMTPAELAANLLKEFGTSSPSPAMVDTLTAVMAHSVLTGRNAVERSRE